MLEQNEFVLKTKGIYKSVCGKTKRCIGEHNEKYIGYIKLSCIYLEELFLYVLVMLDPVISHCF